MQTVADRPKPTGAKPLTEVRWSFMVLCCLPLLLLRIRMLSLTPQLGDFVSYWAAGHLFLTGGHPYSTTAVLAVQRLQGWQFPTPMMTFCPPWAMPALAVMALLPFRIAQITWFAISLVLNCGSAVGLWIYFGGERRKAWIAILVAATFFPMGDAELLGQITPVMLASLTLFLLLLKAQQHFVAGAVLLGFGFKPQLLFLVALAILFWIVKERLWSMIAGAVLSYGIATMAAQLYNPNTLDYFRRSFSVAIEVSCGIGGVLRSLFGVQHQWLQFLPCFVGIAWFLVYWLRHQRHWDWQVHLPLLLIVSICSAPYFWNHDFILILPVLILLAVKRGYRNLYTLIAYLIVQDASYLSYGYGLSDAWRSTAGGLWIGFYCVAAAEMTPKRTDQSILSPNRVKELHRTS